IVRLARIVEGTNSIYGVVENDEFHELNAGLFDVFERSGRSRPVDDLQFESPVEPRIVSAVMGGLRRGDTTDRPPPPRLVPKAAWPILGDGGSIVVPDYPGVAGAGWSMAMEVELAVVVARALWRSDPDEARAAI